MPETGDNIEKKSKGVLTYLRKYMGHRMLTRDLKR
jgi:hypothetical protein